GNRLRQPRALVGFVALLFLLAACAGDGGESTTTTPADSEPTTTAETGATTTAGGSEATTTQPAERVSLEVTLAGAAELTTAPLFVADALGFFEDENLDVEFLPAGGGGNAAAILLGGDAPIGSF